MKSSSRSLVLFAAVLVAGVIAAACSPAFALTAPSALQLAPAVGSAGQLTDWQLASLCFGGLTINPANLAVLNQAFNAAFKKGLGRTKPVWDQIAMLIPSTTAENVYAWLAANFQIREWIGDRVMQNLADYNYVIRNKDFEGTVEVLRNAIADDQYGIYSSMFEQMGDSVTQFPDKLVFQALKAGTTSQCYDGQYFFDTDHPVGLPGKEVSVSNHMGGAGEAWYILDTSKVMKPMIFQEREKFQMVRKDKADDDNVVFRKKYIYGVDGRSNVGYGLWQLAFVSKQTLDATNVRAALTAMGSQKDNNGEPLNTMGTTLVCSPNLYETAVDLMAKDYLAAGESNTLKGRLKVVQSGYLL
ncbi:MAG: Mu-like prophage major head subunit gpT family protein [Ramlibacter sp.]|nr:Mu-like prophage major head subunit gpT family protein [Ramlibacter sp.]